MLVTFATGSPGGGRLIASMTDAAAAATDVLSGFDMSDIALGGQMLGLLSFNGQRVKSQETLEKGSRLKLNGAQHSL